MKTRDLAAFDEAVLAALCTWPQPIPTYVVRNCLDRPIRPRNCAPVRAALYRLEEAGRVRLTVRRYGGNNRLIWQPAP